MSDAPFKGQTLLWNAVLSISSKELDSFDPELKEVACKLIAQVPPLITDLQQVSFKYLVNFRVQIQSPSEYQTPKYCYSNAKIVSDHWNDAEFEYGIGHRFKVWIADKSSNYINFH